MTEGNDAHVAIELVDTASGVVTLALAGELDMATAPTLRAALHDHRDADVVLDLRAVSFLDSTAIGILMRAAERAERAGRRVLVRGLQPGPRRVLEISGVLDRLTSPCVE